MNIPLPFWNNASLRRKRIYSIVFMLVLAILATLIGTLVPISAQDAKQINDSTKSNGDHKQSKWHINSVYFH